MRNQLAKCEYHVSQAYLSYMHVPVSRFQCFGEVPGHSSNQRGKKAQRPILLFGI